MAHPIDVTRRGFLGGSVAAAIGSLVPRGASAQNQAPPLAMGLGPLKPTGPLDEKYWWRVRGQFNLVDGMTFMNTGTYGPSPRVVVETNNRVARELSEDPTNNYRNADRDVVRERLARFVGASPDEIALTRSTSEGMNIFTLGLDWKAGDEVLFNTHEHGGGIQPNLHVEARYGVKIVKVEIPSPIESVDQIVKIYERAITPRTRVIMVSHIPYVTGAILPIKELTELAHAHNILISVDGAHPLGMLDLNLSASGVDHYSAAGQKWLMAGSGTGMLYIKRSLQERIWPLMGYVDAKAWTAPDSTSKGARKYELGGQRNAPSFIAMGAALDLQETIGKANIEARVRQLGTKLRQGLAEIPGVKLWTSNDPRFSAGLTAFSVRDVPMDNVVKAIYGYNRVWIRTMATGNLNAVRASTHIYNMPDEVEKLLDAVSYVSKNSSRFMTPTTAPRQLNFED